jgi:hypothetical protein
MRTLVIVIAFSLSAFGQRHKLDEIDTAKPEGQLLQQCLQENDPAKKAALLEQFVSQYPKLEQTQWVLDQLQAYYVKAGQPDKIISAGDRLLALDPGDPESALQCLKAAEAKKDVALIEKYSDVTSANALKMAAAPQPKDADQVETWKQDVSYAKQVATYADYALFRAAIESRDPKTTITLGERLIARSPTSDYAVKVQEPLVAAYSQTGNDDKAVALAEKAIAANQPAPEMLLLVANAYLQKKQEPQKVHAYAAKAVELISTEPKPAGMSDADWASMKAKVAGRAEYVDGKLYASENNYAKADQELRKALPSIESNAAMKAEVLFMLGFANYKLAAQNPERAQDAATYFRECAAIRSPYQATAARDLRSIRTEYHGIK